ncbi:MAG: hypothetical protein NC217_06060 [Muribaculaceae bacterium]|nr:hypothetical protein [Muribaculaceae bacterium]
MATKNEETQMNYDNCNEETRLHIGSVPPSFETSEQTELFTDENGASDMAEDPATEAAAKRRKMIRNSAIGVGGGALLVGGIAALWANNANADEAASDKKAVDADKNDKEEADKPEAKADADADVVPLEERPDSISGGADHHATAQTANAGASTAAAAGTRHEAAAHHAPVHETPADTTAHADTAATNTTHVSETPAAAADTQSWAKNDLHVSENVSDDMSFADAYHAAREEVGAGGAFVWHGDVYSTYSTEEWDALSPVERTQYAQNFDWKQIDSQDSPVYDPAHPEWADDDIAVATGVNDDMSFSEAFAAAREEVGAGGAFVWHDQVYGTYNADEWNHMTAAERAEFAGHFDWNRVGSETSDVQAYDSHSTTHTRSAEPAAEVEVEPEVEVHGVVYDSETGMTAGHMSVNGEEVVLVDVDNDGTFDVAAADLNGDGEIQLNEMRDITGANIHVDDMAQAIPATHAAEDVVVEPVAEPEVEVVGIVHDENSDITYAGVTIEGEDVLLIDANNDGTMDIAAADLNGDGMISPDEMENISDAGLTVDDLNVISDDQFTAMDDPHMDDYVDDAAI